MTDVLESAAVLEAGYPKTYVSPTEALKNGFVVGFQRFDKLTSGQEVIEEASVPDLDGKATNVLRYLYLTEGGTGDPLRNVLDTNRMVYKEDVGNKEFFARFSKALDAGLPGFLAQRFAEREDLDASVLESDTKVNTVSIGIVGEAGVGKSLLAAILALKEEMDVYTLDVFSPVTPAAYLAAFEAGGLTKDSSFDHIMEVALEVRNKTKQAKHKRPPVDDATLRHNMDVMLDRYLEERPEVMIVEQLASPPFDFPADAYHMARDMTEGLICLGFGGRGWAKDENGETRRPYYYIQRGLIPELQKTMSTSTHLEEMYDDFVGVKDEMIEKSRALKTELRNAVSETAFQS